MSKGTNNELYTILPLRFKAFLAVDSDRSPSYDRHRARYPAMGPVMFSMALFIIPAQERSYKPYGLCSFFQFNYRSLILLLQLGLDFSPDTGSKSTPNVKKHTQGCAFHTLLIK